MELTKERLKIAHVVPHNGVNVLSFTKLAVTHIPACMITFGAECKLIRNGVECKDLGIWNPRRNGINPGEHEKNDVIHLKLASPEDFYANLFEQNKKIPGLIVQIDPDLKTALETRMATL